MAMKMIRLSALSLLLMSVIMVMGVSGCMSNNKNYSAEEMKTLALEYLEQTYSDTFTARGYTASNWAYPYSCITFSSEKYSGSVVEVRAYRDEQGVITWKDNYFHLYMMDEATEYYTRQLNMSEANVKIRFPNSVWSDELEGASSFLTWMEQGTCMADVFVITREEVPDVEKDAFVHRVASDHIAGTITFFTTTDDRLLAEWSLDEILNHQGDVIRSTKAYFINSSFEISMN